MNAEYMMHGFLHVPNASASRAAHVNLKDSQGACLTLEFRYRIRYSQWAGGSKEFNA